MNPKPHDEESCIQIARHFSGLWEFAVWHMGEQLILGWRNNQDEAYAAACEMLNHAIKSE